MSDYVLFGYGVLVLVIFFVTYYFGVRCIRKTVRNGKVQDEKDHQIIKQEIKLADGKLVALEIRVKVLEDK